MRKSEYTNLIKEHFGFVPDVAPAFYYRECLQLFSSIDIKLAQKLTYIELKKRNRITKQALKSVPLPLESVVYFYNFSSKIDEINQFLNRTYKGG